MAVFFFVLFEKLVNKGLGLAQRYIQLEAVGVEGLVVAPSSRPGNRVAPLAEARGTETGFADQCTPTGGMCLADHQYAGGCVGQEHSRPPMVGSSFLWLV